MNLWETTPGLCEEVPQLTLYEPEDRRSDACVVIFPGGGYEGRAGHEGKDYAKFFASNGITAFVVDYRVYPHTFPLPLLDARRAVSFVRKNARQYRIDPNKIAVMGSSAGGHLAAMLCTYTEKVELDGLSESDTADYMPNAQILCYPVICRPKSGVAHEGSYIKLLGEQIDTMDAAVDPSLNVTDGTPQAFIWHTAEDGGVNVINSYEYATALRKHNVPVEMHIFPYGSHGLGLATHKPHVAQWSGLLLNWLRLLGWLK